jgi:hypothetical protein
MAFSSSFIRDLSLLFFDLEDFDFEELDDFLEDFPVDDFEDLDPLSEEAVSFLGLEGLSILNSSSSSASAVEFELMVDVEA